MEITCPHCTSRFNLPDELVGAGSKLRCSVCKTVFVHNPEPETFLPGHDELPDAPAGSHNGKRKLIVSAVLLVLCVVGIYWFFKPSDDATEAKIPAEVELLTMRNIRQYYVDNEKVGKIFVIEGRVVNEFPQPKGLISVEAAIYGDNKKLLALKRQLAGSQLSLFQLQVLSDKEMEAFLNSKMEILSNNTNVPRGGEVPFMVLFYKLPDGLKEFGIRIVDAKDVVAEEAL